MTTHDEYGYWLYAARSWPSMTGCHTLDHFLVDNMLSLARSISPDALSARAIKLRRCAHSLNPCNWIILFICCWLGPPLRSSRANASGWLVKGARQRPPAEGHCIACGFPSVVQGSAQHCSSWRARPDCCSGSRCPSIAFSHRSAQRGQRKVQGVVPPDQTNAFTVRVSELDKCFRPRALLGSATRSRLIRPSIDEGSWARRTVIEGQHVSGRRAAQLIELSLIHVKAELDRPSELCLPPSSQSTAAVQARCRQT
nr:hypothetical protein CFP56_00789 [Quercus suber]